MKELSLSGGTWELRGYWPWIPVKDRSMETGVEMVGVTDWMPAIVPGGVHFDLYREGWIDNPYSGLNSLRCEWIENRWWVYKTTFRLPRADGVKYELVCKGLDYETLVYCNQTFLGEHQGMYVPAVFDITSIVRDQEAVELKLVFKDPPREMGQIGFTSRTSTQKSRFNYKWDFSTHLVNIGPWQDIVLRVHDTHRLTDLSVTTDTRDEGQTGLVRIGASVLSHDPAAEIPDGMKLRARLTDPAGGIAADRTIAIDRATGRVSEELAIAAPALWWPNGYGKQPLYRLSLSLLGADGRSCDERSIAVGIRKLEYRQNEGAPADSLPYTFVINGRPLYIKGMNLTPLDHLYGNVTGEQYEWLVYRMKRAHVNLARIWGGGIIEKEAFYELCDKHGILVWQEFIQSSSGIDNAPSRLPRFLELLAQTAEAALTEKRNHVCLTVWSGGNELMSAPDTPSTVEDENLAMLARLVELHDPQRLFLPTSASGPREFISREKGVSHDVHGGWQFQGNPGHYELYGESDNLFHSEFGVDGVASLKTLRKFLEPQHLKPTRMREHVVWRHHGEWWGTYDRDQSMFGPIDDIAVFSDCSQWMQAEGLRYIIEANRRRAPQSSGSVIWQLNEPWPNASCTNLIDYYGDAKMAYAWTAQAFAPRRATLDYRRLDAPVGSGFAADVYAHSDVANERMEVQARVYDRRGRLLLEQTYAAEVKAGRGMKLGELQFEVSEAHEGLFFVRLGIRDSRELDEPALYVFGTSNAHPYAAARDLASEAGVKAEPLGEWQPVDTGFAGLAFLERRYRLTASGPVPALHIRAEETTNAYWNETEGAFPTLMPGESRTVTVRCTRKKTGGFLRDDQPPDGDVPLPSIRFSAFCQ